MAIAITGGVTANLDPANGFNYQLVQVGPTARTAVDGLPVSGTHGANPAVQWTVLGRILNEAGAAVSGFDWAAIGVTNGTKFSGLFKNVPRNDVGATNGAAYSLELAITDPAATDATGAVELYQPSTPNRLRFQVGSVFLLLGQSNMSQWAIKSAEPAETTGIAWNHYNGASRDFRWGGEGGENGTGGGGNGEIQFCNTMSGVLSTSPIGVINAGRAASALMKEGDFSGGDSITASGSKAGAWSYPSAHDSAGFGTITTGGVTSVVRGAETKITLAATTSHYLKPGDLIAFSSAAVSGFLGASGKVTRLDTTTPTRIFWIDLDSSAFTGDDVTDAVTGGTASGGSGTTLVDTGAGWTVNQYAGYTVRLTGGTGSGQAVTVVSNTTDTLTVAAFAPAPDATTIYDLEGNINIIPGLTTPYHFLANQTSQALLDNRVEGIVWCQGEQEALASHALGYDAQTWSDAENSSKVPYATSKADYKRALKTLFARLRNDYRTWDNTQNIPIVIHEIPGDESTTSVTGAWGTEYAYPTIRAAGCELADEDPYVQYACTHDLPLSGTTGAVVHLAANECETAADRVAECFKALINSDATAAISPKISSAYMSAKNKIHVAIDHYRSGQAFTGLPTHVNQAFDVIDIDDNGVARGVMVTGVILTANAASQASSDLVLTLNENIKGTNCMLRYCGSLAGGWNGGAKTTALILEEQTAAEPDAYLRPTITMDGNLELAGYQDFGEYSKLFAAPTAGQIAGYSANLTGTSTTANAVYTPAAGEGANVKVGQRIYINSGADSGYAGVINSINGDAIGCAPTIATPWTTGDVGRVKRGDEREGYMKVQGYHLHVQR